MPTIVFLFTQLKIKHDRHSRHFNCRRDFVSIQYNFFQMSGPTINHNIESFIYQIKVQHIPVLIDNNLLPKHACKRIRVQV